MKKTNTIQTGYQSTFAGQLFSGTQIPVYLWFLAKNKDADAKRGFRDPTSWKINWCSPHEPTRITHF